MNITIFSFMFRRVPDGKEVEGVYYFVVPEGESADFSDEELLKIVRDAGYDATSIVHREAEDDEDIDDSWFDQFDNDGFVH
ncbi:hypothetical protein [Lysinibacillus sp. LZ02]|uniref:hypothetical protein n=1 Tax=Lysinibacillus sp. LZ02 TaxID=3420668 RepID=UPI003D36B42A